MEGSVLVIGGGIAGIQTSLDLTKLGFKVFLVERTPSIGGRMSQLDKTFPTNDCSLCILAPKMVEQVSDLLEEIASRGLSILLVEQKLAIAMEISNRVLVMGHGQLVFEGTPDELRANDKIRQEWLEV